MRTRRKVKLVHVGRYAAEVTVELLQDESGWAPYLSLEDARKLDEVRDALQRGDLATASANGRVFELRPVASK
jgi:hypothetical protein